MKLTTRNLAARLMALALALTLLCTCDALATTTYSTLEYGSRGSDVLTLQKALLSLGFDPGSLDGKFGRGTETAVKLYQESKKLTADGKAGNLTLTVVHRQWRKELLVEDVVELCGQVFRLMRMACQVSRERDVM